MRYLCEICREEACHNEKLGIHFCRDHGFTCVPVLGESAKA